MVQYSFWCQNQCHIIIHTIENGMYTLNTNCLLSDIPTFLMPTIISDDIPCDLNTVRNHKEINGHDSYFYKSHKAQGFHISTTFF